MHLPKVQAIPPQVQVLVVVVVVSNLWILMAFWTNWLHEILLVVHSTVGQPCLPDDERRAVGAMNQ
jgi:hypothetical protein